MKRQYDKSRSKKNLITNTVRSPQFLSDKTLKRMRLPYYKVTEVSLLNYSYEYWTIRERLHHLKEWVDLTTINMDPSKLMPVPVAARSKA